MKNRIAALLVLAFMACGLVISPLAASTASAKAYATVNGKKVAVGKTVAVSYYVQSQKKISSVSMKYSYDKKALKGLNLNKNSRAGKNWAVNEFIEGYLEKGKEYDVLHLWGKGKDLYNSTPINCKTANLVDTMKFKVTKAGKYKIKAKCTCSGKGGAEVTAFKLTTKVK